MRKVLAPGVFLDGSVPLERSAVSLLCFSNHTYILSAPPQKNCLTIAMWVLLIGYHSSINNHQPFFVPFLLKRSDISTTMSQSETCCICGVRFVRGPKGYNRRKVTTLTSPKTFQLVFDITPDDSSFLCWVCLGVLRRKTKQDGKLWTWSDLPTKVGRPRKPRAEIPSSSTTLSNQTPIITNPSSLSIEEECIAFKKNKRRPVRQWDGEKWTTMTSRSPESHSTTIRRPPTPIAPTTHSSTPSKQVNSSTLSSQTSNQISSLFSFGERTTKRHPQAPHSTTHSTLPSPFPVKKGISPKKKLPFSKTKQSYGFGPHAKALYYMHSHQHLKAFRSLMKTKAREAMTLFLAEVIAQEVIVVLM